MKMESSVIKIENITKTFDVPKKEKRFWKYNNNKKLVALENISCDVKKGEVLGIIGLNGSGKTTLLRIISGIYKPDSGSIKITGRLAPLLQIGIGFNPELDTTDNILMYGMLLGFTKREMKERIDRIIEFAELGEFKNMKLKFFSDGMRARLGFGTALEIDPDILIVDEVLAVGDEVFRKKSFDAFISFKQKNKTIIFTNHNIDLISKYSDKVLLLEKGKMIKIGSPEEIIPIYKKMIKNREE
jgi:ABC-type polysaccharide/polyol phosphate transport system ATPase subunit